MLTLGVSDGISERRSLEAIEIMLSFISAGVISATAKAESEAGWRERK